MIATSIGRVVQFIVIFFTIKISTTFLSPSELAKLYLINSIAAFFALIFINPVGAFMNRRFHPWNNSGKIRSYYLYFIFYLVIISFFSVLCILPLVSLDFIKIDLPHINTLLLVAGSLLIICSNQSLIPTLNFLGRTKWFSILTVLTSAISLLLSTLLVNFLQSNVSYWLLGIFISNLIFTIIGGFIFLNSIKPLQSNASLNKKHLNTAWDFGWPIALAVGLGWIQSQSYRFIAASTIGLAPLGMFLAGYGVGASLIIAFDSIMNTYLLPVFYKNIDLSNEIFPRKAWNTHSNTLFPSLFLISLAIISCLKPLSHLMLGKDYWEASQFAAWGVANEVIKVFSGAFSIIPHAQMRTTTLIYPSIIGVLVFFISILIFLQKFGPVGIGLSLVLSQLSSFIMLYLSTDKSLRSIISLKEILNGLVYGSLILVASFSVLLFVSSESITSDVIQLLVIGCFYLIFQFLLIRNKVIFI